MTAAGATRHFLAAQPDLTVLVAVASTTTLAYTLAAWLLRTPEFRHVSGYVIARRAEAYTAAQVS